MHCALLQTKCQASRIKPLWQITSVGCFIDSLYHPQVIQRRMIIMKFAKDERRTGCDIFLVFIYSDWRKPWKVFMYAVITADSNGKFSKYKSQAFALSLRQHRATVCNDLVLDCRSNGANTILRNVGHHLQEHKASQSRRTQSKVMLSSRVQIHRPTKRVPTGFPTKTSYAFPCLSHCSHMPSPS